jgi:hypothetical protein
LLLGESLWVIVVLMHMVLPGNAPVMIYKDLLSLIVEDWYDIALRMKSDDKAEKAFGWILEMVCSMPNAFCKGFW